MFQYQCLNPISKVGLDGFTNDYIKTEEIEKADAILVRSASMHEMKLPENIQAIARAGAGVNNIPLKDCAEQGIVVFNTPGANANGVKEMVIAGMLLASRDIVGGIEWVAKEKDQEDIDKLAEKQKKQFAGCEIMGKKLGVIGLGAVGVKVANAAVKLGMNVYGYDPAYADSSKFSMGSATKVTVDANTANNGQWPTATFTFKGTGFDVISLTDNNSGAISVKVYSVRNDGTETQVKGTLVNNYYGYTCKDGKWTTTPSGDNNALYQIPVIKISGLDYGTYKVVITASYATFADKTGDGQYNFWLDAIRVYDPMGKDNATYEQDNEGYPQYIKLRDSLVGETATAKNGSVFIDGADKADIATYANYGPNNEVYLAKGQAISFKLTGALDSIASVQIGAKSPDGTDGAAVISVNGQKVTTATEMYYAITDTAKSGNQVTIANNGTGILSLTNLKITYTESGKSVSLDKLSAADQANAVAQVRALFAAPAEPFNPDLFTASWGHSVRKGETAKLTVKTSEDVEAITVNGETIDSFTERHERTGWGWWAKTVTYREFIYTTTADVTRDYTVCAVNAAGVRSEEKTATLTVRPSVRDWLHGIIGKWF